MKKLALLMGSVLMLSLLTTNCKKEGATAQKKAMKSDVRVASVIGKVDLIREGSAKAIKVRKRMKLRSSDVIRTGKKASVKLLLGSNRGVVVIKGNSYVNLSNLMADRTKLDIEQGKVKLALSKITGKREFALKTPTAVAGVRGTTFMVDVEDEQPARPRKKSAKKK
jgi:hypothetical protein